MSRPGRWRGFIEYRRRYVSDRTWFGLAFLAVGFGGAGAEGGWTRVLLIALGLLGVVLVASGVRRAWGRHDPADRGRWPSPPL